MNLQKFKSWVQAEAKDPLGTERRKVDAFLFFAFSFYFGILVGYNTVYDVLFLGEPLKEFVEGILIAFLFVAYLLKLKLLNECVSFSEQRLDDYSKVCSASIKLSHKLYLELEAEQKKQQDKDKRVAQAKEVMEKRKSLNDN